MSSDKLGPMSHDLVGLNAIKNAVQAKMGIPLDSQISLVHLANLVEQHGSGVLGENHVASLRAQNEQLGNEIAQLKSHLHDALESSMRTTQLVCKAMGTDAQSVRRATGTDFSKMFRKG